MREYYIYGIKIGNNENRAIWDEERLKRDEKYDYLIKKCNGGNEWKVVNYRKMKLVYCKINVRVFYIVYKEWKRRFFYINKM